MAIMDNYETISSSERDYDVSACKYRVKNVVTLDPTLTSSAWRRLNTNQCKAHYELLPLVLHIGFERALKEALSAGVRDGAKKAGLTVWKTGGASIDAK